MAVIIGRVSEHNTPNITVGGKVIFVPPEKRNVASNNFPVGSVAKVTVDKGTVKSILPPSELEMRTFTLNESPGNAPTTPTAIKPVPAMKHIETPPPAPAAKPETPQEVVMDSKTVEILPGSIISVMIGGTLNLGNYNNVKMEVTATSAEAARTAFQQEINTTVGMMQGIIKQVGVKS